MAANFNKVIIAGNLTRDPELRTVGSGTACCQMSMAINRTWFDKPSNSKKEETTFVEVTLWGKQAENAGEYLQKGSSVLVEGRLKLDTWDDKATGQKRSKLVIVGEAVQFLTMKSDGKSGGRQERQEQQPSGGFTLAEDYSDVPF